MRLRLFEFDGTVEEFQTSGLRQTFSIGDSPSGKGQMPTESMGSEAAESPTALRDRLAEDENFLHQVLAQHPLSPALDGLLRQLLKAEPPRMVCRSEIGSALGLTQNQIDGVLGWLGRRVNATPREHMNMQADTGVLLEWERANGEWCYRLRPTFRRVLEDFYGDK